jgi:hypothetical protein
LSWHCISVEIFCRYVRGGGGIGSPRGPVEVRWDLEAKRMRGTGVVQGINQASRVSKFSTVG